MKDFLPEILIGLALIYLSLAFFYRKILPSSFVWLNGFFLGWLIINSGARMLTQLIGNNLPLLHAYGLMEFIFLSLFYRELLQKPAFLQKNFNRLILIVSALIIANTVFLQSPFEYNSYGKTLSNVVIISYTLFFIYNLLTGNVDEKYRKAYLWINSVFLIYFTGTVFVFLLSDFLLRADSPLLNRFWSVSVYLNVLEFIIILLATLQIINARKNGSPSKG